MNKLFPYKIIVHCSSRSQHLSFRVGIDRFILTNPEGFLCSIDVYNSFVYFWKYLWYNERKQLIVQIFESIRKLDATIFFSNELNSQESIRMDSRIFRIWRVQRITQMLQLHSLKINKKRNMCRLYRIKITWIYHLY